MLTKINYVWRLLGTAFSFIVFGVGGLALSVFMVPVLYCLSGDELTRTRRAQRFIHRLFQLYIRMMRFIGILTYQIDDIDKLQDAKLILANHPSLLDVVFLISMVPNANCVVNGQLSRNFFTRGPIKAAGYIMNEEAEDVIAAAARVIDDGQTLIVFPEGTRTNPSKELQFKRGAANVAIRTGSDITPVLIYCAPTTLTKSESWYQIPDKPMHYRFLVRDQLKVDQYIENLCPSRGARNLSADLLNYFNRELKTYG
jgi:1-acyl-sn-glycerol-3-phosphate acyltransferase